MTDAALSMILGSFKAMVLLMAAAGVTLMLRRGPARLRAVVWTTALAGSLMIPVAASVLPSVALPVGLPSVFHESPESGSRILPPNETLLGDAAPIQPPTAAVVAGSTAGARVPDPRAVAIAVWLIGVAIAVWRLGTDHLMMHGVVMRSRPVSDVAWLNALARARASTGCPRKVRLVASAEVNVPATVGARRPVIILPETSWTWGVERRRAVLLHELIHVVRFDWTIRIVARIARAVYWFNPLAWWAVRRLDLEQEIACDEEVLSLGGRASSYACHLLAIARAVSSHPTPAISGLAMARRSHLEERIMTMLNRSTHRRVGPRILLPTAVLTAAMVPAIAAVSPGDPPPRHASPELKETVTQLKAAESRLEPQLERLEGFKLEIDPQIEIDQQAIEEIEARLEPYVKQIEQIEIDMEPYNEKLAELDGELNELVLHMEDGTLEEIERQIRDQMAEHMKKFEAVHAEMEPLTRQMEELHQQMEPLHRELERVHLDMEPVHREMEKLHEHMDEVRRGMEPLQEELELLGDRFEAAVQVEVAAVLREHLGAVTTFDAPFDEAAARIVGESHLHVIGDVVELDASRREVREILTDLMKSHMTGLEEAFAAAIDDSADALSPLQISIE